MKKIPSQACCLFMESTSGHAKNGLAVMTVDSVGGSSAGIFGLLSRLSPTTIFCQNDGAHGYNRDTV